MRKFKAFLLPKKEATELNETAVGIEEYEGDVTIEIHSLFIPEDLSNKGRLEYVLEYVNDLLDEEEQADLRLVNVWPRKELTKKYDAIFLRLSPYRPKFEMARSLCYDATGRKGSVRLLVDEME